MSFDHDKEIYLAADILEDDPALVAMREYIESLGGQEWSKHFWPHLFTRPFTHYQDEYWQFIDGIEADKYYRPRVECEPRGVGKSTNAEGSGANLVAKGIKKMVGYVSLNNDKAQKHFDSIKAMFENDKFQALYPHCAPKVQTLQNKAAQWSREAIVTANGAMIVPLSLLGSSRGWKSSDGKRFDLIFLDDIDELGQSPEFIKKLIELLKGEILAAGDDNTLVIMPQNLIHRDSICTGIYNYSADILTNRVFCGPYPLLRGEYEAEKVDLPSGGKEWQITKGEPFDPAISVEYCQKLLNLYGKATFDRECQQKVFEIEDDKDFREWDEMYHLVTHDEFREVMENVYHEPVWNESRECLQIPPRWNVGEGLDFGTTRKHPTVVTFAAKPAENSPLKECQFIFGELVKPKFPLDSFERPEIVSPGRIAEAIRKFLDQWNVLDSQVVLQLMSHEQSAALNTMALDLSDENTQFFNKWKAKKGSGVPQIQELLTIDRSKPHPFRKYPAGFKIKGIDVGGLPLMGCPKVFFLVANGQGELLMDSAGQIFVAGAKDALGFARARFEIPIYSYRNQGDKKIDDDFCFIAGTEILTLDGLKPIETVTTNDKVLTRKGWRKVVACGKTQEHAKVFHLTTLDGRTLIGTGNHPIFTKRGVVALRGLTENDRIYVWKEKLSPTKTSSFIGIPTPNNYRIGNIFSRIFTPGKKEFPTFILKSGKTILAAFLKTITSTIKTTITTIIQSKILSVCLVPNILPNTNPMSQSVVNHQNTWSISGEFEKKQVNGTEAKKDLLGIPNTPKTNGLIKLKNKVTALFAEKFLTLKQVIANFVLTSASGDIMTDIQQKPKTVNVEDAKQFLLPESRNEDFIALKSVGIATVKSSDILQNVFNLTVEDCPEYFANGILVHNCDSWRGLENVFGVPMQGKTHQEKIEDRLPEPLKAENIDSGAYPMDENERDMTIQKKIQEVGKIERDMKKPILPPGMARFRRR